MPKHLKNIVKGIGSILNIAPVPKTHRYIPQDSDNARLHRDLQKIGQDMYRAFDNETNVEKTENAS